VPIYREHMKITVCYSPMFQNPGGPWLIDLPEKTLVEPTGKSSVAPYKGSTVVWLEIEVQFAMKKWKGWIYENYLDELITNSPSVVIDDQTLNEQDAEQYIIWKNFRQYNLCGHLCIAYIVGAGLSDLLNKIYTENPVLYQSLFPGGVSKVTSTLDLDLMLKLYNYVTPSPLFLGAFNDPVIQRVLLTPLRLKNQLRLSDAIVLVRINNSGELTALGSINHWVVLSACDPRERGSVSLYNPFKNRVQVYSWP